VNFDSISKLSIEHCFESYHAELGQVPFYLGIELDSMNDNRLYFTCLPVFTIEQLNERCFNGIYYFNSEIAYVRMAPSSRFNLQCIQSDVFNELSSDIPDLDKDFTKLLNFNIILVEVDSDHYSIHHEKRDDFYMRRQSLEFTP
jgi:hypothetical protein